tara:strand:- start:127 stop:450 length:324 start_codon:yes stop_codon:yes gene_type:complete
MPKFKKSSGFKMKGFSYPGKSPVKFEADPEEFGKRIEQQNELDDVEGLTDDQKGEIADIISKGAEKMAEDARKRQREALGRMNFRNQRAKFSGGEIPNLYNPSGLPS